MRFETSRLIIRELQLSDHDALCQILQDKRVMRYVDQRFNDEQVEIWMQEQLLAYRQLGIGMWVVEHQTTHQIIGVCGITLSRGEDQCFHEMSYYFLPDYWHQGYASETVKEVLTYAFETLHIDQIISIVRDSNLSSIKVCQHCGMQVIQKYHRYVHFKRQLLLIYALKKDQFLWYNKRHENNRSENNINQDYAEC